MQKPISFFFSLYTQYAIGLSTSISANNPCECSISSISGTPQVKSFSNGKISANTSTGCITKLFIHLYQLDGCFMWRISTLYNTLLLGSSNAGEMLMHLSCHGSANRLSKDCHSYHNHIQFDGKEPYILLIRSKVTPNF